MAKKPAESPSVLTREHHPPERNFGPFHSGIGVAIWLNERSEERRVGKEC